MTDERNVKPTSSTTAVTDPVVLRETSTSRLIFDPTLIENPNSPEATVRGRFRYEKKGSKDVWQAVPKESLSSLKKGEGYELELKSGELYKLVSEVAALYDVKKRHGIPWFDTAYVKANNPLAKLAAEADESVRSYVESQPTDALKTFGVIARWITEQRDPDKALELLAGLDAARLEQLATLSNLHALRTVMTTWLQNRANGSEEFWQGLLTGNAVLLDFAFPYSVQLIQERAYVGGKKIKNTGGSLADFLLKRSLTRNTCVLEIKTPTTRLMGAIYRTGAGVYAPSAELVGSVTQVLTYRSQLEHDIARLRQESEEDIEAWFPPCCVLVGSTTELDDDREKRRSFELFRTSLQGVTIVTFDEVYDRVVAVAKAIKGATASQESA